jgi:hypothetical protein
MSKCPYCDENFIPEASAVETFEAGDTGKRFISFDCPHCMKLLFIKSDLQFFRNDAGSDKRLPCNM